MENWDETKAVGKHFGEKNAGREDMKFVPFITVKSCDSFTRKLLEWQLIRLQRDHGLRNNKRFTFANQ